MRYHHTLRVNAHVVRVKHVGTYIHHIILGTSMYDHINDANGCTLLALECAIYACAPLLHHTVDAPAAFNDTRLWRLHRSARVVGGTPVGAHTKSDASTLHVHDAQGDTVLCTHGTTLHAPSTVGTVHTSHVVDSSTLHNTTPRRVRFSTNAPMESVVGVKNMTGALSPQPGYGGRSHSLSNRYSRLPGTSINGGG